MGKRKRRLAGGGDEVVIALGIVAGLTAFYAVVYKLAAEGLILYMKKNKYTPPSKEEMVECLQERFKNKFKWYKPKSR